MCGIAGVINFNDIALDKMRNTIRHRGPDDESIYTHQRVALIHTRLSIQDVSHGSQPFHYGNYSIIFNGEIYNHLALRSELSEYDFKTQSDTETLLYLYIKFKESMFEKLDGMFAFCIYNKQSQQLVLARDRAGKKPIYYYHDANCFIFASEINAIKAAKQQVIDYDAVNCYLRTGFVWKPHTIYKSIKEVEPGACITVDINELSITNYIYFNMIDQFQCGDYKSITLADAMVELDKRLYQSVSDRIAASDVEVGVFLSGGIDSNLIAAMAAKIKPNIKTFTVKFDGAYDESSLAKIAAAHYRTQHIELTVNQQLRFDIEKILFAYGEPFMDSSAIPTYYVAQAARKEVKVVLSGDGADELFAGYRRYIPARYQLNHYTNRLTFLKKILAKPTSKQSIYNYIYRLLSMASKNGLDYYLSSTTDIFEDHYAFQNKPISNEMATFIDHTLANKAMSMLQKTLYLDFMILLYCDLLVKMDIAAMANSLEVRSPFLSKYILTFAPSLPDYFKINQLKTKYILRRLAEKYLPKELINQPKRGFEVPLKSWVDNELHEPIHDYLNQHSFVSQFVDYAFINKLKLNQTNASSEKRAKMLWTLYCFEVWHRHTGDRLS